MSENFLWELHRLRQLLELLENARVALNNLKEFDDIIYQRIIGDVSTEKINMELEIITKKLNRLETLIVQNDTKES